MLLTLLLAASAVQAGDAQADARQLIENCNARKFETTIVATVDDKPRKSQVKLCGREGQSDSEWVGTLKDAVGKVAANEKMPPSIRAQITAALTGEIARLEAGIREQAMTAPLRPRNIIGLPDSASSQPSARTEYAVLPPLPPPTAVAPARVVAGSTLGAASLPLLPKPKMSLRCLNPGDLAGDGPCTSIVRDTMITVRAGETLPAGTSLRFVRNGDARADVALAQLRSGRSYRFRLPADVCEGGGGGRMTVDIVRAARGAPAGQVVGSEGPYLLNC